MAALVVAVLGACRKPSAQTRRAELPGGASGAMLDLPALVKRVGPSVVLLSVRDGSGRECATGTGFIVSRDGRLVTNHHVIARAASVAAKMPDGSFYAVEGLLLADKDSDLAILQLGPKAPPFDETKVVELPPTEERIADPFEPGPSAGPFPFLSLGDGTKTEAGERVVVIGSPLGLENSVTEGIVSARRKMEGGSDWLQISAPISPGSSGSPVVNLRGQVIGVATRALRGGQALNFARPVESIASLIRGLSGAQKPLPFAHRESDDDDDPVRNDPDFSEGFKHFIPNQFPVALACWRRLAQKFPQSALARSMCGMALAQMKFHTEAVAEYRAAIALDPTGCHWWSALAETYSASGRHNEALEAIKQAEALAGDSEAKAHVMYAAAEVYRAIARAYDARGGDGMAFYELALKSYVNSFATPRSDTTTPPIPILEDWISVSLRVGDLRCAAMLVQLLEMWDSAAAQKMRAELARRRASNNPQREMIPLQTLSTARVGMEKGLRFVLDAADDVRRGKLSGGR